MSCQAMKPFEYRRRRTAVKLAQLGEGCRGQANVINLKRLLNGKQNVWKYQNGEEKSDSDRSEEHTSELQSPS